MIKAHNKCAQCHKEWTDLPGGHSHHDCCPYCKSVYWTWLNYMSDFAKVYY